MKRYLLDRFATIPGVSQINIFGSGGPSMRVWIDRVALAARNLTVTDIETALNRENLELPAGKIQSKDRDFQVRIGRNYQTDEQFRDLVLAQGKDGHLIRLGEVARVQVGPRENQRWFRTNGKTTTGFGIIKQSTANVVEVLDAVKAEVERVNHDLPKGMNVDHERRRLVVHQRRDSRDLLHDRDHDRARGFRDLRLPGFFASHVDPARYDSRVPDRDVLGAVAVRLFDQPHYVARAGVVHWSRRRRLDRRAREHASAHRNGRGAAARGVQRHAAGGVRRDCHDGRARVGVRSGRVPEGQHWPRIRRTGRDDRRGGDVLRSAGVVAVADDVLEAVASLRRQSAHAQARSGFRVAVEPLSEPVARELARALGRRRCQRRDRFRRVPVAAEDSARVRAAGGSRAVQRVIAGAGGHELRAPSAVRGESRVVPPAVFRRRHDPARRRERSGLPAGPIRQRQRHAEAVGRAQDRDHRPARDPEQGLGRHPGHAHHGIHQQRQSRRRWRRRRSARADRARRLELRRARAVARHRDRPGGGEPRPLASRFGSARDATSGPGPRRHRSRGEPWCQRAQHRLDAPGADERAPGHDVRRRRRRVRRRADGRAETAGVVRGSLEHLRAFGTQRRPDPAIESDEARGHGRSEPAEPPQPHARRHDHGEPRERLHARRSADLARGPDPQGVCRPRRRSATAASRSTSKRRPAHCTSRSASRCSWCSSCSRRSSRASSTRS